MDFTDIYDFVHRKRPSNEMNGNLTEVYMVNGPIRILNFHFKDNEDKELLFKNNWVFRDSKNNPVIFNGWEIKRLKEHSIKEMG